VSLDLKVLHPEDGVTFLEDGDYLDTWRLVASAARAAVGLRRAGTVSPCGLWLRHLALPTRTTGLAGHLERLLAPDLPIWLNTGYRPFGRARADQRLNRSLNRQEIDEVTEVAHTMREKGREVWIS
jgi:uncharacterized Fe-S radical SAM superfamily protein PflX